MSQRVEEAYRLLSYGDTGFVRETLMREHGVRRRQAARWVRRALIRFRKPHPVPLNPVIP